MAGQASKKKKSENAVCSIPLLQNLSEKPAALFNKHIFAKSFRRGAVVFHQGDEADAMYFVLSGAIEISLQSAAGEKIDLVTIGAGQSFGEIALIDRGLRTATATAAKAAELQIIDQETFARALKLFSHDDWLVLMKNICLTLRRSNTNLEILRFQTGAQRVAAKLVESVLMKTSDLSVSMKLKIRQDQLADMASLSRENTNRILKQFERQNLLRLSYGHIEILDGAALSVKAQPLDS